MRRHRLILALVCIGLAGCSTAETHEASSVGATMTLTSPAFAEGEAIPVQYTCDGDDLSPPLAWTDVPQGVVAFALIVTDPDAGGFVHWVLDGIPGDARDLPAGDGAPADAQGENSFGRSGWDGPCPPSGEHHYLFALYALSAPLEHGSGVILPAEQLRFLMEGKVLATGQLTGTYSR